VSPAQHRTDAGTATESAEG